MSDARPLQPASPDDYGLPPADLAIEKVETARELANDARQELSALGFTDPQIDAWADSYTYELGEGSVRDLIGWIAATQDVD